jgi:hypothetical protein
MDLLMMSNIKEETIRSRVFKRTTSDEFKVLNRLHRFRPPLLRAQLHHRKSHPAFE